MFAKSQRVHFIGIGGIGMSGIAEILLTLGYDVSGSDLKVSSITDRLAGLGAIVFEGHAAANVIGAGVVVTSSAVTERNPEVMEARLHKIPVIQRAEMLAELMRLKYGIAVAGMHGKTTTTSMIAAVLAAGELDPTIVVGGRMDALGSNARLGKSRYLVAEADESDRSFLKLSPILAVVTNLDREHMDCYRDMADVEDAFVEFMDRVPFYGSVTACLENDMLAAILPRVRRRVFTYGTMPEADFVVRLLPSAPGCHSRFEVVFDRTVLGPFALNVPGRHNVLNATAAVAIAIQLEVAVEKIAHGLASFHGVDRRFQTKGIERGVTVVDDYGHHPTEIRATLAAARDCGYKRIHVIFQPHRYTRTRDLMEEFIAAFSESGSTSTGGDRSKSGADSINAEARSASAGADSAQILDIYAASEEPIPGLTARALVAAINRRTVEYAPSFELAAERAASYAGEGDLILTLGAGNVSQIAALVLGALKK